MKASVFCACIILLAAYMSGAVAGEKRGYRVVAKSANTVYFMDTSSVKQRKGYLSAWFLFEEITPYRGGLSSKHLLAVDCEAEEHGFLSFTRYTKRGGKGDITESHDVTPELIAAPPGSAAESIVQAMCQISSGMPLDKIEAVGSSDETLAEAQEVYGDLSSVEASFLISVIE